MAIGEKINSAYAFRQGLTFQGYKELYKDHLGDNPSIWVNFWFADKAKLSGSTTITFASNASISAHSDYCQQALDYFARMDTEPPTALKVLLNTTIADMISNGIWDELDQFVFMNLHTAQASTLNVKGNYNNHTWYTDTQPVSFTAFTATEIKGNNNGTAYSHIDTNFNASLATKFTQNNAGIYFDINKNGDTTGGADGAYDTTNWNAVVIGYNSYASNYINQSNTVVPSPIWTTGSSMFVRIDSYNLISRINGVETGHTFTSGTPPNSTYTLGVMNYGGTLVWGHHTRYKYYGFGSAMDATKRAAFDTILTYFNNNIASTSGGTTGGTTIHLTGTTTLTFASSSTIAGKGAVIGTSPITFASSTAIRGKGNITGSSPLIFNQVSSIRGKGAMAGSTPVLFSSNANISVASAIAHIAGTTTMTFASSSAIAGKGAVIANAFLTFGQSAGIRGKGSIAGTSPITFNQSAGIKGKGRLAGTTALIFNQTGDIYDSNSLVISQTITGSISVGSISGNIQTVNLNGTIPTDSVIGSQIPVTIIGKISSENLITEIN